jgi:hypothetical protein
MSSLQELDKSLLDLDIQPKHPGGRLLKFKDVKTFQKAVDAYFRKTPMASG